MLTHIAYYLSRLPKEHGLGSDTILDSARLRYFLGKHFQISPKDISAYAQGRHGDNAFVCWSGLTVGGMPFHHHPSYTPTLEEDLAKETKHAACEIIEQCGATAYVISLAVIKIVRSLLYKQNRIFSVSTNHSPFLRQCRPFVLVFSIVSREERFEYLQLQFTSQEREYLSRAAERIATAINFPESLL